MDDDDEHADLQKTRSSVEQVLHRWESYMSDLNLTMASLSKQAEDGKLAERGLRSLSWRYFFDLLPSPAPLPSSPTARAETYQTYSLLLSHSRSRYTSLRERYLRSPDGNWIQDGPSAGEGGEKGGEEKQSAALRSSGGSGKGGKAQLAKADARMNNPLGQDEGNVWNQHFEDLELRKEIRKDVQRTFPEVSYFRLPSTQDRLTNLLFIYCKLTPEVGYRQGMHELLAPLLWTVDYDSLPATSTEQDSLPHFVLARDWVEHDTWSLFSSLMKGAAAYYDHRVSTALSPRPPPAFPPNPSPSASSTPVQPIVSIATHLHSLLSTLDPTLHASFTRLQIEPQLFAIRWFRLLFSREFPLSDTLLLWDGLFARDPALYLATYIALAMLLRVRDALVAAAREGYGEFLHVILRYPPCPDGHFHTPLLLQQALYLRDQPTLGGANFVKKQNTELGFAVGIAQREDEGVDSRSPSARGLAHRRAASAANLAAPQGLGLFGARGLVGDLAKGVYGRAEALGINAAVSGVFNDLKRDFAEAQAQLEEQRRQRNSLSQIPGTLPWEAPPPPPAPAAKDALSDLAKMRASSLSMSSAIDLCVAVLEKGLIPPTPVASPDLERTKDDVGEHIPLSIPRAKGDDSKAPPPIGQVMALTALKHIRDVLSGSAQAFDPSVLAPLHQVLATSNGSPAPSPTAALSPTPTYTSPPLPPLPSIELPQPRAASLAPPPPLLPIARTPSPIAAPATRSPTLSTTTASSISPRLPSPSLDPTSTPSLLLGSRREQPSTGLSRTPQPRTATPDPLGLTPSRCPPSAATQRPYPSSAPPSSPHPASFTPSSFSSRPPLSPSGADTDSPAAPPSKDPLGAL
ncbi:hypothetical protein JCM11641_004848 [Rhodosporidiobolus odoratus]